VPGFALALALAPAALAQQQSPPSSPTFDLSAEKDVYTDNASTTCSEKNTSPYKGMNPLVCYGVTAPTDNQGECSLNMPVFKKEGNTCIYCQLLNPPIQGIIIPIDNLADAEREGFKCGVDQTDPSCSAVCTGNGLYNPPPGTIRTGGPPLTPVTPTPDTPPATAPPASNPTPVLQGSVNNGGNPCEPFGPGGYNYCANPSPPPPGCTCSKLPQPTDPGLTPSPETPGGLPLPPDVRQQLLNTAAQVDKVVDDAQAYSLAASDHFFKCLGEAVSADLKFLAQPGYVPAAQIANSLHSGVTNYFTGNAYANNMQAYQAAQQGLNNLAQDPACFAANVAPAIAAAAVTHLAGAAAEANATQQAANDAMKIATEETERETAWNAGPGKYGDNPANPKNPACAPNMCFPSAIAEEVSQETGVQLAAEPFAGNVTVKIVGNTPTNVFNLTSSKTIQTMLQDFFGSKRLQGPALSPQRMANQMIGQPSIMQSGAEIQQELAAAGPGARGLVFVEYNPTATDPNPAGHVFNVRNVNGVPMARDFSNAGIDASSFFNGVKEIWFYRTQ
jgi:hypothetical protein